MALDYQRVIDWLDDRIVDQPGRVVAVFLVVTAVFAVGAAQVSTEAGTESFAEDVPEQEALEAVNREFDPAFGPGTTTTQLIHTGGNVLSKPALARMLTVQYRLERRAGLRIAGATGYATGVEPPSATSSFCRQRRLLTIFEHFRDRSDRTRTPSFAISNSSKRTSRRARTRR